MLVRFIIRLILLLFAASILHIQTAGAVKIVRLELEYGSDIIATGGFDIPKINKTLDVELYDDITPVTVANYLNYVNDGRYDLTFINRSTPGFVLQTGGVTNIDPDNTGLGPSTFGEVIEFPPIVNEPGLSNVRGTIAMAKLADQPDSATSEWFINLNDNSNPLDTENSGYTVFGSIIDDGMETADQVATFPIMDISFLFGSSYQSIPIPDYDMSTSEILYQSNLVMILSASVIDRPILRFTPADSDFGFIDPNDPIGKSIDVVLKNTGNQTLDIGPISAGAINAPYSIQSEGCSNTSLEPVSITPTSFCTISLKFLPAVTGIFINSLTIDYTSQSSGNSFSVKYHLSGEGAIGPPEIVAVNEFDVGASQVDGYASKKDLLVNNVGQASLQISAITGLSSTDFSQTNNCIGNATLIASGESCIITVSFTTSDFGAKSATLTIESNDPVNKFVDVTLSGYGDSDADGVLSAIEDAAPNSGDNNFDGTADSLQNDVVSFISKTGEYISLVVDSKYAVINIRSPIGAQLPALPTEVDFKYDALEYDIAVDTPGAIIEVGLILPSGVSPEAYYFFGETAKNATPHWYQYENVQIFANSTATTSNGELVRNFIKVAVQDGGPGDADKIVNNKITLGPAAAAFPLEGDGGGSLSVFSIIALISWRIFTKLHFFKYRRYNNSIRTA